MRRRQLTATIEPFDSFWEAPDDIEKGYRSFYLFYKDNYGKLFPADKRASILCVSCGPGYGVNLLNELGYANVLGVDSFPDKIDYALKRKLNCKTAYAFDFLEDSVDAAFDLIFVEQELNHLTKPEILDFLALCKRKLKPGGRLICFALNGANPITGARNEIVIDSSPGLGEAVVSGMVTPDHFVLRRGRWGWRVTERRPGRREVVIQARLGGGTENIEPPARSGLAPLPGRALRRLAHLGAAIQHHFDRPQDVEWAWANGQVSILQARPMTALPEPLPQLSRPVQMLSAMFAEMFPIRPYPLDQTSWVPAISAGAVEPLFKLLGLSVPSIATFFVVEDGVVVRFSGRITARPTLALLVAPARILWMAIRYDPRRFREDHQVAQAQTRIRVLQAQDSRTRSWEAAFVTVHEALALPLELAGAPRQHYLPRAAIAVGLLRMVLGLLRQGHRFGALFSDVESRTLETNRALETLADRVRSEPELADLFAERATGELRTVLMTLPAGAAFLIKLQSFLDDYGHREVAFLSTILQAERDQ